MHKTEVYHNSLFLMLDSKIVKNPLIQKLYKLDINNIAKQHSAYSRHRKINPVDLLVSFFIVNLKGQYSLSNWASQLGLQLQLSVSKQAIWKRLTQHQTNYLSAVLTLLIHDDLSRLSKKISFNYHPLFHSFKRVLVHDSTTIQLPDHLRDFFKGNSCRGERKSLAKIQAIINLKDHLYTHIEVSDFSTNDQKYASQSLPIIKKGDLIIRDLGYFALDVLKEIMYKKAFFISKFRYGIHVYDVNEDRIDLNKILQKKTSLDMNVLIGKRKIPVRLIAQKVNDSIAEQRRRKARNDRDKRYNHSKEYYYRLGFNIYITNVDQQTLSLQQIVQTYALRWRIETVFKTWKSHLNFQRLMNNIQSRIHIEIMLYSLLIFTIVIQMNLYNYFWWKAYEQRKKYISITKFTAFLNNNLFMILAYNDLDVLSDIVTQSCCYETRQDRANFGQKLIEFPLS